MVFAGMARGISGYDFYGFFSYRVIDNFSYVLEWLHSPPGESNLSAKKLPGPLDMSFEAKPICQIPTRITS